MYDKNVWLENIYTILEIYNTTYIEIKIYVYAFW